MDEPSNVTDSVSLVSVSRELKFLLVLGGFVSVKSGLNPYVLSLLFLSLSSLWFSLPPELWRTVRSGWRWRRMGSCGH